MIKIQRLALLLLWAFLTWQAPALIAQKGHSSGRTSSSRSASSSPRISSRSSSSSARSGSTRSASTKAAAKNTDASAKATKAGRVSSHVSAQKCTSCARDSHGRIVRSEEAKKAFMAQTGYPHGRKGYVVDHKIPLARGGTDAPSNMQWQTIAEAKAKDKIEWKD